MLKVLPILLATTAKIHKGIDSYWRSGKRAKFLKVINKFIIYKPLKDFITQ